jgi:translocation and assembly module TamB
VNKRHIARKLLIAIPSLLLSLVLLCIIVLNTSVFRDFVRSEIRKQAFDRAGVRVDIGTLKTRWNHLGLEADGIVIRGAEETVTHESPLFQANRLDVTLQLLPLLRGKVQLAEFILDQPVLHLRIDSQGRSNLPSVRQPGTTSVPDAIFDLEVQNCTIHSGEIYYNDARVPLDADLHDLKFESHSRRLTGEYVGSLSYDKGRLMAKQLYNVTHAVQLEFVASRSDLFVKRLLLTSGSSHLVFNGHLKNYASPSIEGTYAGDLFTTELAKAISSDSLPVGDVALDGKFGYHTSERQPFLAAVEVQGRMRSRSLSLRTNSGSLDANTISANYELQNANLRVANLAAEILGGHAQANWEMLHLDAPVALSRLDASVKGVSLKHASDALSARTLQKIPLTGTMNMNMRASWSGSVDNAVAHLQLAISNPHGAPTTAASIPVSGLVKADYDGPNRAISFGQSYLQTQTTKISVAGTLGSRRGDNSNLTVLATASDLREVHSLITLIQNAMPAAGGKAAIPALGGSAMFDGTVSGSAKDPRIRGQLTAQNLTLDRSHLRSLTLSLVASSSQVAIQNGMLVAGPHEQISFSGSSALQKWSIPPSAPIELHATAANLALADIADAAQLHYPVTGTISAHISINGTREVPEGNATLTLTRGSAWSETINNLALNAMFHQGTVKSAINLQIPAGTITADASYTLQTRAYGLQLHGGDIQLGKISAIERAVALQGAADLSVSGNGTVDNPQLEANLTAPHFQIRDQVISETAAHISVDHQHANVTFHSVIDQGSVDAKVGIDLNASRYAVASVDVRGLPIAAVLANVLPVLSAKVGGQTEIHVDLRGPLETPAQIEAHLEVPSLNMTYGAAHLELARPLRADLHNGELTLASAQIRGTGANLTLAGRMPIHGAETGYSVSADGSLDLAALQNLMPNMHSSGQINIHLSGQGTSSQPRMLGQLQLKDVALSADAIPIGIEGVTGQVNLSGNRAEIVNLSGAAGGGKVSATGFVSYGQETAFNVGLSAQSVRIRYPEGLRSILSGQINVRGNPGDSTLTGRVLVDRLSFTQAFDLANFAGYFSEDSTGSPASPLERHMKLSVAVQSAQDLNLASSKLSMGGSANLNVTGTLADPVLLGRIVLSGGEVFFLGKRFEVQSGTIEFANTARTEPVLRLYIATTVEQYNITVNLSGPVDRLRTNYTSEPSLPPADIVHLLAFGNTSAEAASAPTPSAAMGAESLLAQGVSSQVAGKLENLTGISQLTIDPLALDTQGNPGAQVAIQERVTGSLLLTFSTDVTGTQSKTVELQYDLNKRTSVTVLRDQNGGYGIELRLHKVF